MLLSLTKWETFIKLFVIFGTWRRLLRTKVSMCEDVQKTVLTWQICIHAPYLSWQDLNQSHTAIRILKTIWGSRRCSKNTWFSSITRRGKIFWSVSLKISICVGFIPLPTISNWVTQFSTYLALNIERWCRISKRTRERWSIGCSFLKTSFTIKRVFASIGQRRTISTKWLLVKIVRVISWCISSGVWFGCKMGLRNETAMEWCRSTHFSWASKNVSSSSTIYRLVREVME